MLRSTVRVNTKKSSKAAARKGSKPEEQGSTLLLSGEHAAQASAAARAIAAELGKTVRRTSLAKVVGKYAGETERNLARLFTRATELDVVLILDDADALFGKRKTAERYAHMQMNHLLRMIEGYKGVAVVTAKSDNALDPQFLGRFAHVRDIGNPAPGARIRPAGKKSPAKHSAKAAAKAALKAQANVQLKGKPGAPKAVAPVAKAHTAPVAKAAAKSVAKAPAKPVASATAKPAAKAKPAAPKLAAKKPAPEKARASARRR